MRSSKSHGTGALARFWSNHCIHDSHSQPGNPKSSSDLPNERSSITPEKAKLMLHDNSAQGHPLTPKQRGLFGAIANKGKR